MHRHIIGFIASRVWHFLVMWVSQGPWGFGEQWNIGKISKGKREHKLFFREKGQG